MILLVKVQVSDEILSAQCTKGFVPDLLQKKSADDHVNACTKIQYYR